MITNGWLEEVDANLRRGEPLWRETGDGHGTTLIATEAGLEAIGIEPVAATAVASARKAKPQADAEPAPTTEAPNPIAIRTGTKQAQIIALLQRPEGASNAEIVDATGWKAHTARGAISGALKKKLGLQIISVKEQGRGSVYRIG
jgi:predicted HTH transcriptional regulator